MKTQIIQKLTSRKFWMAVASFVAGAVLLFGYAETTAEAVTGGVMMIGSAVGFLLAEGIVDATRIAQILKGAEIIVGSLKDETEDDNTEADTEDEPETEGGAENGTIETEPDL